MNGWCLWGFHVGEYILVVPWILWARGISTHKVGLYNRYFQEFMGPRPLTNGQKPMGFPEVSYNPYKWRYNKPDPTSNCFCRGPTLHQPRTVGTHPTSRCLLPKLRLKRRHRGSRSAWKPRRAGHKLKRRFSVKRQTSSSPVCPPTKMTPESQFLVFFWEWTNQFFLLLNPFFSRIKRWFIVCSLCGFVVFKIVPVAPLIRCRFSHARRNTRWNCMVVVKLADHRPQAVLRRNGFTKKQT